MISAKVVMWVYLCVCVCVPTTYTKALVLCGFVLADGIAVAA